MRISYSHNFIFIHVPKTAGTSVVNALAPYTHDPLRHWMNSALDKIGVHVNYFTRYRNKRFRPHTTAKQVLGPTVTVTNFDDAHHHQDRIAALVARYRP